ncbi:hypothetical protein BJ875DRAFT_522223 [Amylocarpus encephaloides]|uniref:Myb-like domain-containing protein n=1 Tax=Amylocarpus encephaloides TaxID=45428 RepID=A0A9P7YAW7_9HELO|nr:hypothetical protein BJ875DRAFT_522223 [Amylocarpus encephaloides]
MATATKPRKVHLSLTSWVLGGSLVSVTGSDGSQRGRKVLVNDSRGTRVEVRGKLKEQRKIEEAKKAEEKKVAEAKKAEEEKKTKESKKAEDEKKAEEKKKEDAKKAEEAEKDKGESSDGASTSTKEAKRKENEKKADDTKATTAAPAKSKFTTAQDAKILSMKNDNKPWKEIVVEIGCAKKDVVARFKELSELADCVTDNKKGEKKQDDDDEVFEMFGALKFIDEVDAPKDTGKEKKKETQNKKNQKNVKEDHGKNRSASLKRVKWASPKLPNVRPTPKSPPPEKLSFNLNLLEPELMCQCEECKRDREEEARQEQQHKHHSPKSSRNTSSNNKRTSNDRVGFNNNCNNSCGSNNLNNSSRNIPHNFDNSNTKFQPQVQVQEEIYRGHLKPNSIWSKDDCEVLEELERRHKNNKWLEVQAGFFNWTGRMVEGEIIQKKFREDGAA